MRTLLTSWMILLGLNASAATPTLRCDPDFGSNSLNCDIRVQSGRFQNRTVKALVSKGYQVSEDANAAFSMASSWESYDYQDGGPVSTSDSYIRIHLTDANGRTCTIQNTSPTGKPEVLYLLLVGQIDHLYKDPKSYQAALNVIPNCEHEAPQK